MIEEFQVINSKEGLGDLRVSLERIALSWNFTKKQLFEINLILEELCANFIEHVGGEEVSFLEIKLSLDGANLSITFQDSGPPFNPTSIPAPDVKLPIEQRNAGGVGLHLVKKYTDLISYSRESKKNIIYMEKKLE
jgi:anti-sigma regulatory factor (Ser/Thr protein kinase)